jgi:hypothetical protein
MEVQIHGSQSEPTKRIQVRIGLTKKWYRKGLGPARKPSPRICIDNKPQNSSSYLSIVTCRSLITFALVVEEIITF